MEQFIKLKLSGVTSVLNDMGFDNDAIAELMPNMCRSVITELVKQFPKYRIDIGYDLILVSNWRQPVTHKSIRQTDTHWGAEERKRFETAITNAVNREIHSTIDSNKLDLR